MTIRVSARIAGLAVLAAEAAAVATQAHRPLPQAVWTVLIVLQLAAVLWATDRRSAPTLRMVAPAALAAVTTAAMWTALALSVPVVATGDATALGATAVVGPVVAALSPRGDRRRRVRLALVASAGAALLVFLAISWILPTVPGFVSDNHPPTYPDVTRLVDPIGELATFVLLAAALGVDVLRTWFRDRRRAAPHRTEGEPAFNEMVVERAG
ncbi:hypothetical protein [Catellatospora tritici]|uniref:hypothetical protein n=1 Tax=Catellatospora tritici TaxID=2851566 RepID=UPI001C2D8D1E|nr:hypothetical protein [Catellatospora tritici]MBV1853928.1 hypothetical protein [Catellatospora tritici]